MFFTPCRTRFEKKNNDRFLIIIFKVNFKIRKRISHVIIKKELLSFQEQQQKIWTYLPVRGQGVLFGKTVAGRRGRKPIVAADIKNVSMGDNFVPLVSEHIQDHFTWLSKAQCGSVRAAEEHPFPHKKHAEYQCRERHSQLLQP